MTPLAQIVAVGARTPIGLDAVQSGFLHRTGIPAVSQGRFVDGEGEPIGIASVEALGSELPWEDRLGALLRPAITEALQGLTDAGVDLGPLRSQLLLGVPGSLGGDASSGPVAAMGRFANEVLPSLASWRVDPDEAGAAAAAQSGLGSLGANDLLVLAGVHSDHDQRSIDALLAAGRLYTSTTFDGRLPGEAAGCVILASPEAARRHRLPSLGAVLGMGGGVEAARPDNDEPAACARGLTQAVHLATASLVEAGRRAGWMITDVAFEPFRLIEWQSVYVRARAALGEPYHIDAIPQRLGYLGAATVPVALTLAAQAWRAGYAPADCGLVTAGSDAGARVAFVVAAP